MNTASKTNAASKNVAVHKRQKLQISRWIWKPWYAKLWWASAGAYWVGFVLSFPVATLRMLYESALGGYLNVALYPPVILMVLCVGYIRAKFDTGDWVLIAPDPSTRQPERSVGGFLDPMADPLDPRSPLYQRRYHNP